ncbi:MAG: WG repeat-containing protein [Ferruginibacter sp.]|nr:WG repeat-containing protein [Ferruginibacter sp.]
MVLRMICLTVGLMLFGALSLQAQEWYRFQGKNGKYGFKLLNNQIVKPEYDDAAVKFSYDMAAVKKNGKWGYINKATKKLVIPLQYDMAYSFNQDYAKVQIKDSIFFIDRTGKRVDPDVLKNERLATKNIKPQPFDPTISPEPLPITINSEKNNKTIIQLGTKEYEVKKDNKQKGMLTLSGDLMYTKKYLTAPHILHIPGYGLVGFSIIDSAINARAMYAKTVWAVYEDDGLVKFSEDKLLIKDFTQSDFSAEKILHFGHFEKGDYTKKKLRKSGTDTYKFNRNVLCYASLYEGSKRKMLWEDVQHMMIHPKSDYSRLSRDLNIIRGKNKSIAFVNHRDSVLSAIVFDSALSAWKAYQKVCLIATNDGSSATAYTLHNIEFQKLSSFNGKTFGPWSNIYYTVMQPTEHEGYYKVLDENNEFFTPENSYGLLPFITTHAHIRRDFKSWHRVDTTQRGFEVLHFFFAALKDNESVKWQPVNFNGKPYPTQENEYFLHWELVDCKSLSKVNAINAMPYLLLAYTSDSKWQTFFPSKYGITYLPPDLLNQYKYAFPPLTEKCETAEDAYVKGEVQVQIIQTTHQKGMMQAYEEQKRRSDQMWAEYRRKHAGRPSGKVDWSAWSKMSSSWGGFSYTQQVSQRYRQTVSEGERRAQLKSYNNYLDHVIRRAGQ